MGCKLNLINTQIDTNIPVASKDSSHLSLIFLSSSFSCHKLLSIRQREIGMGWDLEGHIEIQREKSSNCIGSEGILDLDGLS